MKKIEPIILDENTRKLCESFAQKVANFIIKKQKEKKSKET